jgi:AcrR family transcriptional regulator
MIEFEESAAPVPHDAEVVNENSIPTWRQKQRQAREEAILDAARTRIAEIGYEAMTMEELAEQVGISKPTLYQHFASKEALAVRSLVVLLERNLTYLRNLDPGLPAGVRFAQIAHWVISQRFSGELLRLGGAKISLVPVVRSHPEYVAARKELVEAMGAVVRSAQEAGAISPALAPRTLLQMLFSVVRDCEYDELIASGECSADEVTDTLTTIYLNGMRKTDD